MILKVKVTADDIEGAFTSDSTRCPIANALRRQTGESVWVEPMDGLAYVGSTPYALSGPAIMYATRFDAGLKARPACFLIRA